jgi:beta-1,4-N-acetylglucosaminyltransferase
MDGRMLFITVGTTLFEELIQTIDTPEFLQVISQELGFDTLCIQYGKGSRPQNIEKLLKDKAVPNFNLEVFDFAPSLQPYLDKAHLIISHGGSGTILECLRGGKRLIVVINRALMHDHQTQLAKKLADGGHLQYTDSQGLLKV